MKDAGSNPAARTILRCSQVIRHDTLTVAFRWFESNHLSQTYDSLAQLVEHLTFNQGVWSSNLQWVTK